MLHFGLFESSKLKLGCFQFFVKLLRQIKSKRNRRFTSEEVNLVILVRNSELYDHSYCNLHLSLIFAQRRKACWIKMNVDCRFHQNRFWYRWQSIFNRENWKKIVCFEIISKKERWLFTIKELQKTDGGPCKAVNSSNSWSVLMSNKLLGLLPHVPKVLFSFMNSYNKPMMKQAMNCSTLFFFFYLPTAGKTSVIAGKKSSENFASDQKHSWIYAKVRVEHFQQFSFRL